MKVAIAGAGNVGRSIAAELVEHGHHVLLLESDSDAFHPSKVHRAEWVLADACELASLENARVSDYDVMVAATGDDKVNLVVSLLAKTEFAVPRVVARVNRAENEWLFNDQWGVDVAVSKPRVLAALVEEAVTVGELVRLMSFQHSSANLVEITLMDISDKVGQAIANINLPRDSSLVAIVRGDRVITPTPRDTLEANDELVFVCQVSAEEELKQLFTL